MWKKSNKGRVMLRVAKVGIRFLGPPWNNTLGNKYALPPRSILSSKGDFIGL